MRKVLSSSVILLLGSASLLADVSLLEKSLTLAESLYGLGNDNNQIDSEMVKHVTLSERYPNSVISKLSSSTKESLSSLLRECVFMEEGAYGMHLSKAMQDQIATQMADYLMTFSNLQFYRISGKHIPGSGYLDTPACAMGVRDGEMTLVMQGGLMD